MAKPRRLTTAERATLDFLLSADLADAPILRAQAAEARVAGTCECGCATITLAVPRTVAPWRPDPPPDRIAASAFGRPHGRPAQLLLHVIDGRLAELEIVDVDDSGPQSVFPPPKMWQEPVAGPGPSEYQWPDND